MLIIDRFEEGLAVCVDTETDAVSNISLNELPTDAAEGDVLVYTDGKYTTDHGATAERREKIKNKLNSLFNKNKGSSV